MDEHRPDQTSDHAYGEGHFKEQRFQRVVLRHVVASGLPLHTAAIKECFPLLKVACAQCLCSFIAVGFTSSKFGRGLDFFEFFNFSHVSFETQVFRKRDQEDDEGKNSANNRSARVIVPVRMVLKDENLVHASDQQDGT